MMNESCTAGRREKHVEIEDAIVQLSRIDERIRGLIEKITGTDKVNMATPQPAPPSPRHPLGEFLSTTGNRLIDMREKTLALLDELESLLF